MDTEEKDRGISGKKERTERKKNMKITNRKRERN